MIRKFTLSFSFALFLLAQVSQAQVCTPDTSLHKPGYKPAALPNVKADSNYNESISILVKRDTFKMVGPSKVNVKIDSVRATSVIGLPSGYQYECQNPRCVFLWDTVRCVRIFGKTSVPGIYPIKIPVIGYAKIGSSSFIQKDTIRDFTLVVEGGPAGTGKIARRTQMVVWPQPANDQIRIWLPDFRSTLSPVLLNINGQKMPVNFVRDNQVFIAQTTGLAPGLYLLQSGETVQRIMINR